MNQEKIKLSICVAIYNVEAYLKECIDSIMSELSYLNDDVEVLLVDDCSTDSSAEICKNYLATDDRLYFYRLPENQGLSGVRNFSIHKARGQWITFVDGDDILTSGAIRVMLSHADADYDVISFKAIEFEDGQICPQPTANDIALPLVSKNDILNYQISLLAGNAYLSKRIQELKHTDLKEKLYSYSSWAKLFRADFINANHLQFDLRLRKAQDIHFTLQYVQKMSSYCYIDNCVYGYRLNDASITRRFSDKRLHHQTALMTCLWELLVDSGKADDPRFITAYYWRAIVELDCTLLPIVIHRDCTWDKKTRISWLRNACSTPWVQKTCEFYHNLPAFPKTTFRLLEVFFIKHNLYRLLYALLLLRKATKRK